MMKFLHIIAAALLLASCSVRNTADEDPRVLETLDRAGRNSSELRKVLDHYSDNPEKLAAARFLIANMSGHYGYSGPELDSIEATLYPLTQRQINFIIDSAQAAHWQRFYFYTLPRQDDQYYINADYLIENIDHAYERWKTRKWNADLSFDDFCEQILPYRIGDERLTSWRKEYADRYEPQLDSIYSGSDAVEAARLLFNIINSEVWRYNDQIPSPHRDALALLNNRVGYNRDWCDLITYAMRACGIPVAIDMLLEASSSAGTHQWLVVRDNLTGRYLPFGVDAMVADRTNPSIVPRAKGKVYRYRFATDEKWKETISDIRSLPLRLNNIFITDVSSNYFNTDTITVDVDLDRHRHVYLGIWTPTTWRPIAVGEMLSQSKARFTNVEPGVICAPIKLDGNEFTPAGYPFYVDQYGKAHMIKPDSTAVEKVRLTRTFPMIHVNRRRISEFLAGSRIILSRTPDFSNPDTLYTFTDTLWRGHLALKIPERLSDIKYVRYTRPDNYEISLGNLALYGRDTIIPYSMIENFSEPYQPQYLNDESIYTLFTAPKSTEHITLAINAQSIPLKKIDIVPRIDHWFVKPGHNYELYYLDGVNGWKSLGTQIADEDGEVDFVVPANSLLKLYSHTEKSGGQAFIYRMNRQLYSIDMIEHNSRIKR